MSTSRTTSLTIVSALISLISRSNNSNGLRAVEASFHLSPSTTTTMAVGVGMGLAYGPLLLSVLNATPQSESGMVSGVVSTSWILGGTLGFAVLVGALTGRSADFFNPGADVGYIQTSG